MTAIPASHPEGLSFPPIPGTLRRSVANHNLTPDNPPTPQSAMPLHLTEEQLNEPIAKHLRTDFTTLSPEWTVGEALDHMRRSPPPGRIIYFYVVDEFLRLVGVVPTRRLLLSPVETKIRDVMIANVVAIPA